MERKLEGMKRDEEGGGWEVHWHRLCCSLFLFVHFPSDRGLWGGCTRESGRQSQDELKGE
jgi:hypothetical protein